MPSPRRGQSQREQVKPFSSTEDEDADFTASLTETKTLKEPRSTKDLKTIRAVGVKPSET